jgi:chromate reductase
MKPTILTISGSLRANSSNNAVIAAAVSFIKDKANVVAFEGLGSLPHFDDNPNPAKEVLTFRELIRNADGVLICSPEYAFGVPGSLKNALDWTVSSGEFMSKPVALITAATGGDKAHAALLLTLRVISSTLPDDCALLIPYIRSKMNAQNEVTDAATLQQIDDIANALLQSIAKSKEEVENM